MGLANVKPPMNIPPAPPPPLITPAGQPVVHIPGGIPENWPSFEKCPQLDLGLVRMACVTYPWEKDDYNFDFESVYPPIPDDFPEWAKKIVELTKHDKSLPQPLPRVDCPFCPRSLGGYKVMDHEAWMKDHEGAGHVATFHLWNPRHGRQLPRLIKPEDLERTKRYLRQLRNTRGYDIDCYPHPSLVRNRLFIGDQDMVDRVEAMLQEEYGVIAHITKKTDKLYKLKEVHKVVWGGYLIYLVTFSAIDVEEGSEEKFLATLNDKTILECLRHPLVDAPMPDIPECAICPADIPDPFRGKNLPGPDLCSYGNSVDEQMKVVFDWHSIIYKHIVVYDICHSPLSIYSNI